MRGQAPVETAVSRRGYPPPAAANAAVRIACQAARRPDGREWKAPALARGRGAGSQLQNRTVAVSTAERPSPGWAQPLPPVTTPEALTVRLLRMLV